MDALEEFSDEAKQCATLATETRVAFNKWGKMVGELHACTEQESGTTSQKRDAVKVDQAVTTIEQRFASVAAADSKTQAEAVKKQLDKAEKRLDNALENVPGPWAQVAQGALTGFAQAVPSIVAGVLPAVLAAANPAYGISQAAGAAVKQGVNSTAQAVVGQVAANGAADIAAANTPPPVPTTAADPAYGAALGIKELTTHFYEYLGGEKGKFDMSKFKESESTGAADSAEPAEKPQSDSSISYLIGSLKSQKDSIDVTNTEPNKKLHLAFDRLIKVSIFGLFLLYLTIHLLTMPFHTCRPPMASEPRSPTQTVSNRAKSNRKSSRNGRKMSRTLSTTSSPSLPLQQPCLPPTSLG